MKRLKMLILTLVLSGGAVAAQALTLVEQYALTGGHGWAVAVRDYHVFLADGPGGLKILNLSYPPAPTLTGRWSLRNSNIQDVAVDGDWVVLTDPTNRRVHVLDVWELMSPQWEATIETRGDVPRRVALAGSRAFVTERGDNFSGMEVIDFRRSDGGQDRHLIPVARHLIPVAGINDVLVPTRRDYPYVLVAARNEILVFRQTVTESEPHPVDLVRVAQNEEIQSLAFHDGIVFVFGLEALYAAGPIPRIIPRIPVIRPPSGIQPSKQPLDPKKPVRLRVVARAPVEGPPEHRRVDAAVVPLGDQRTTDPRVISTTDPRVMLLLTAGTSYGLYAFRTYDATFEPWAIERWRAGTRASFVLREVPQDMEGGLTIFDSGFPQDFGPGVLNGSVIAIGAIGSKGFGYVYSQP